MRKLETTCRRCKTGTNGHAFFFSVTNIGTQTLQLNNCVLFYFTHDSCPVCPRQNSSGVFISRGTRQLDKDERVVWRATSPWVSAFKRLVLFLLETNLFVAVRPDIARHVKNAHFIPTHTHTHTNTCSPAGPVYAASVGRGSHCTRTMSVECAVRSEWRANEERR